MAGRGSRRRRWLAGVLLAAPVVAMLWVPLYNVDRPRIAGIPFFYVYQIAWIAIGAVLTGLAYLLDPPEETRP